MNTRSTASRWALLGVTVVLVSAVTAPVEAQRPRGDADTVDGKHAVGAAAKPKKRAGKLVATDKKGRLPNNIIQKAPDANLLDGRDASEFATTRRPIVLVSDAMKPPARTLGLTGTPVAALEVPLQVPDECGDGETVHRYHVEFSGWLLGGDNAFMEASMTIDSTSGHAFGEGTVVGSAYNAVASSREVWLLPGAHSVNLMASKTGADALTLVDGYLGVTDLGYECGVVLRRAPTSVGSGPAGT